MKALQVIGMIAATIFGFVIILGLCKTRAAALLIGIVVGITWQVICPKVFNRESRF